jgi:hypothetical protein
LLGVFLTIALLEACSNRLCPAYGSYPESRRRR